RELLDLGEAPPDLESRRSEEHTCELQSRRDLVCRLLRENKKRRPPHLRPHQSALDPSRVRPHSSQNDSQSPRGAPCQRSSIAAGATPHFARPPASSYATPRRRSQSTMRSSRTSCAMSLSSVQIRFFFTATSTTKIYTLSLHDALPSSANSWISGRRRRISSP